MNLETGILAAAVPTLAAFAEWKNPVDDEVIRRQARHTINEQGLAVNPGQQTALENAIFGVARGAASVSSLLPTVIAFVATAIATINDLPQRIWWADGIIALASLAVILIIRAVGATTFFGLATDPAGPVQANLHRGRSWLRWAWDRLAGNIGTGSEWLSALIYLFNFALVGLIVLNVGITWNRPAAAEPTSRDQAAAVLALSKQLDALTARARDQAMSIDAQKAQIDELAHRVSLVESVAPPPASSSGANSNGK